MPGRAACTARNEVAITAVIRKIGTLLLVTDTQFQFVYSQPIRLSALESSSGSQTEDDATEPANMSRKPWFLFFGETV